MDASTTELEFIAARFAGLDPGLTKRGKPRKRRNLAALARALGVDGDTLRDAHKRGAGKIGKPA